MSHGLILASASQRRRMLLSQIGVPFVVRPADICEKKRDHETPEEYCQRLAIEKADAIYASSEPIDWVLGADTCVSIGNQVLHKPQSKQECIRTLLALSGKTHQVRTAVALVTKQVRDSFVVTTDVSFKALTEAECEAYWLTGEPKGKAGSYAIQGLAATFVEHITGSYSNIVGLPLFETAQLLQQRDLSIWQLTDQEKLAYDR